MNEQLRNLASRSNRFLSRYTPAQRRNLAVVAGAFLILIIALSILFTRPHYVSIMSGLDDKSLGQVQTKLEDLKIPNKVQGSTVLVPAADANTAQIQLSMAGLPQSGYIGYSSITNSLGMTQDEFNIQVLNVLQESLGQTIESINGIESAQVHIVMPDTQLFISQPTSSAKASVFVQLAPGTELSSDQVGGIQNLVAHAVKGLTAGNVTVVDQSGDMLSAQSGAQNMAGTGSSELATTQQLEAQLTQEITQGLEQIVGPNNVEVMVHANVTYNQVQSQSHTIVPAPGGTTGYPSSTQTTRSTSTSGNGVGGAAGQASTNPGVPTYSTSGSGSGGGNSQSQATVNYLYSTTDTSTTADPIQLNGFTVGVLLNSADKALTPAVQSQIRSFVANALGMKAGPNAANSITVSTVPFQTAVTGFATTSVPWALYGGIGGGLLAIAAAVWFFRRRRAADGVDARSTGVQVIAQGANLLELEDSDEDRVRSQLANLASQRPDEFAGLLRSWLLSD